MMECVKRILFQKALAVGQRDRAYYFVFPTIKAGGDIGFYIRERTIVIFILKDHLVFKYGGDWL